MGGDQFMIASHFLYFSFLRYALALDHRNNR